MVNKEAIEKLIAILSDDLSKLKTDQSYFYNEPMYFNYAIYWDALCHKLTELDTAETDFGSSLLWSASTEIMDNKKELWQVVESIIDKLDKKLVELEYDTCNKSQD